MKVRYVQGDATRPESEGPRIIAHVCNDQGGWGAGFVVAISRRWKEPEAAYRRAAKTGLLLGDVEFVPVGDKLSVANMVAQVGYGRSGGPDIPLRYDALHTCLKKVAQHARYLGATVHMPRIGCGLAGGKWEEVERLIADTLLKSYVPVTVYDLPGARWT